MEVDNIIKLAFADVSLPEFKELVGEDYVRFGIDNKYPEYLTRLYNKSAKHAAIINGKINYIFGGGLKCNVDESDSTKSFIKKYNEVIKKSIADIETYGGFYWQIIPNLIGSSFTIFHVPFEKIRVNKSLTKFQYKNNWQDRSERSAPLPLFSPELRTASIFSYKQYRQGGGIYAMPDWLAAINFIESDIEVSKHTYTNATKGFSATKFVNFYNGVPNAEGKREVTKQFRNEYGGSQGETTIIAFNEPNAKEPKIDDLGQSSLSKEDFTQVDNLITGNIFAAHSVTHPLLFGIQQAGKLGGGNELRIAYDIFKNTYVSGKQKQIEDVVNYFASLLGLSCEFSLIPTDPIGLDFSYELLLQAAPRSWVLEKLGIDTNIYSDDPIGTKTDPSHLKPIPATNAPQQHLEATQVNENIKNLTAKQHQQLLRIIRQYSKGQITRATASLLLKSGLALTDTDIDAVLGTNQTFKAIEFKAASQQIKDIVFEGSTLEENDYSEAFADDESVAMVFMAFGESKEDYTSVFTKKASFVSDEESSLIEDAGVVAGTTSILDKAKSLISGAKKVASKFEVRYSYEKRPDAVGANILPTSRAFCVKMVAADKYFTKTDIQNISSLLGYDVFLRTGGFWNNHGTVEYHCRHEFRSHVVIKKK